jgi:hypothetical protein
MSYKKKNGQKPAEAIQPKRFPWLLTGLIVAGTLGAYFAFRPVSETASSNAASTSNSAGAPSAGTAAAAPAQKESAGQEKLIGHWLRPDGGYILEIRGASPDGRLTAGYFNPNPINVGRAEWKKKDGKLQVFVELRDVNYPGSTYTLDVSAKGDQMSGNYFQATQQQNFAVEFIKQR